MKRLRVCVVIPAYNEGRVIREVIRAAKSAFKKSSHEIDVVVVNDGSKDDTSTEAAKGGAIVIDHILNSGAGLSYANQRGYDIAATMDADGQHDPKDILHGIDEIIDQQSDLLIGSRLIHTSAKDMSLLKRIGNWGLSVFTMLLFGAYTTDSQSGMRIYSRRALEQLRWKTSGYEFCSEMIWRANQLGLTIGEYPIQVIYTDYSKAKGQNNWNGVNILKSLIRRRLTEIFE
jgi:glycosyltransferase involved in cell wall biosynthesis